MDPLDLEAARHRADLQHGLIRRDQVLACGVTRHALEHLVTSRRWVRVLPGVYSVSTAELTDWARASAASLWLRDRGALARRSAAAVHGLLPWPEVPEVVVRGRRAPQVDGLQVHLTRELPPQEIRGIRTVRVTDVARTLCELGALLDDISLGDVLAQALQRRLVSRAVMVRRLDAHRNDPHTAALRSMLAVDGRPDSGVELALARALKARGHVVRANGEIRGREGAMRRGDIVMRRRGVVIQVESGRFHSGARLQADIDRDADWLAAGFVTIRVSARRVRSDLASVVAEIEAALVMHPDRSQPVPMHDKRPTT